MKKIFLALLCCFLLCESSNAQIEIKDNALILTGENITAIPAEEDIVNSSYISPTNFTSMDYGYYGGTGCGKYATGYHVIHLSYTRTDLGYAYAFRGDGGYTQSYDRWYEPDSYNEYNKSTKTQRYSGYYGIVINSNTYYWKGSKSTFAKQEIKSVPGYYYELTGQKRDYTLTGKNCRFCGQPMSASLKVSTWTDYKRSIYQTYSCREYVPIGNPLNFESLIYKNCSSTGLTIQGGSDSITVNGGNYKGAPAFVGSNTVITKGTITDTSGASQFVLGEDSESSSTSTNGQTITTVKLSNPPVIIDWADFPG